MSKSGSTKEKLVASARELFWTRGYSNVSVRDITGSAGVDAALVSRYFGGKQGLFEATLAEIPPWDALTAEPGELLKKAAESFAHPFDPEADVTNVFTMLLTNVIDPEMGGMIRELVQTELADPLTGKIDGPEARERAALLLAVLFGVALMRKNFRLEGLADKSPEQLQAEIIRLGRVALEIRDQR
ncbi:MAG: TetR family transcriptional regulator [Roseibium sp.]|uniref:TetR/AcrR family transcriptional regulator n=1 Tax=Roseibium sp. TaxID=1936156 RepID=UPI003D9C2A64